jgi:hypothetical protein
MTKGPKTLEEAVLLMNVTSQIQRILNVGSSSKPMVREVIFKDEEGGEIKKILDRQTKLLEQLLELGLNNSKGSQTPPASPKKELT